MCDNSKFIRDLRKLCVDHHITIPDFMRAIHRRPSLFNRWIEGDSNPTNEDIININNLFDTDFVIL